MHLWKRDTGSNKEGIAVPCIAAGEEDATKMVLDTRSKGGFDKRMAKCEEIIKEVYSEVSRR